MERFQPGTILTGWWRECGTALAQEEKGVQELFVALFRYVSSRKVVLYSLHFLFVCFFNLFPGHFYVRECRDSRRKDSKSFVAFHYVSSSSRESRTLFSTFCLNFFLF